MHKKAPDHRRHFWLADVQDLLDALHQAVVGGRGEHGAGEVTAEVGRDVVADQVGDVARPAGKPGRGLRAGLIGVLLVEAGS